MRHWLLPLAFCFFTLLSVDAGAQTATITGRVIDAANSEPLPFANVFINNTTIGVATNGNGEFDLKNVPGGTHELVFSFVGYEAYQTRVTVKDGEVRHMVVKLISSGKELENVEVESSQDKEWQRNLRKFEKIFLGDDQYASQCKIKNPWVLEFKDQDKNFIATASAGLEIENQALGYDIIFYLKSFSFNGSTYAVVGNNTRFKELPAPNARQALAWMKNREDAYFASPRYLMRTILDHRITANGFRLYGEKLKNAVRFNFFSKNLQDNVFPYDTVNLVVKDPIRDEYKIMLKDRVEVHNLNLVSKSPFYKEIFHAVSWIEARDGIRVNSNGVMLNPKDVTISGDMSVGRIASILPLNYEPKTVIKVAEGKTFAVKRLQERVYIHTDKPYYYPGETIWMSAYMNYRSPFVADTLSKVLYVDLMDSLQHVSRSLILKIDSGKAVGDFVLPPDIVPGLYTMRSYTEWMRNYGIESFFYKKLPVLDMMDRMNPAADSMKGTLSKTVSVKADKAAYKKRDRVTLTLELAGDEDEKLSGLFSMSVTDVHQVVDVERTTIVKDWPLSDQLPPTISKVFKYPIERGISISGTLADRKGPMRRTSFTAVQGQFETIYKLTTDNDGRFYLNNMDFYDSSDVGFQVKASHISFDAKDKPIYIKDTKPAGFPLLHAESVQRILSPYEVPDDAILLSEVEVSSTRVEEQPYQNKYGKPDYYLKGENLMVFGSSLAAAIQARIPGYRLVFTEQHWYLLRARSELSSGYQFVTPATATSTGGPPPQISVNSPAEPVVFIDDNQLIVGSSETIGDRLNSMSPAIIDHIEVSSMITAQIGATGAAGMIAIYTKNGKGVQSPVQKMPVKKLNGFNSFHRFKMPDYADKSSYDPEWADYRSTLYWDPLIRVAAPSRTASVSFFTSDLIGKYRIVVEGVTGKGIPVRIVSFIDVVD